MIYAADIRSAVGEQDCAMLAEAAQDLRVLEVGSEFGRSTIALASMAAVVHSVDWHQGDRQSGMKNSLPDFLDNLARYGVRLKVVVHVGRWEQIAPVFRPGTFQLAFVDACHDQAEVLADLDFAAMVCWINALIFVHDVDQPVVFATVDEWCRANDRAWHQVTSTLGRIG